MTDNKSKGIFWLLVLGGCGVYFYNKSSSDNNGAHHGPTGAATATAASTSKPTPELPYAEQQFIKAVHDGHAAYDAASNDMQKGATRPRRSKAVCAAIPSGTATSWIGTIYKLSSNNDGKGVLEVQIAPDVWVETWNNSLSDIGTRTLIEPDSDLFSKVSAMSSGQSIRFSGNFFRDGTDCYRESSMSISGSMTEPEYIMKFTSVDAL